MQTITSVNNQTVLSAKLLHQKKHRDQEGLFLVEGLKVIEEAVSSNLNIQKIFLTNEKTGQNLKISTDKIFLVNEAVMKKLSTTDTPAEIIAIIEKPKHKLSSFQDKTVVLLDNVKDPGNLGTIIRTAAAFGISAVVLTGETVDIYNPKVIRATVGNLWKIPVLKMKSDELKKTFKNHRFLATTLDKNKKPKAFFEVKKNKNTVIMFGSEAGGLSDKMLNLADEFIMIPMENNVESLNLSISAGIVMYEFSK